MAGINFVCRIEGEDKAIKETIKNMDFSFPEAHINSEDIAKLSKEIKKHDKNTICVVPFCSTVEVESFGGNVNLGDNRIGPRVSSSAYSSMEELVELADIDFNKGRVKEVLDAIEKLSGEEEIVTLNVSGPFIIITSLVDSRVFYKTARKDKDLTNKVIEKISDNIISFAEEGVKRGAKIISYEDSVGSVDIVGPKLYKDLTGKVTSNVLKGIGEIDGILVHICGKTSVSLEKHGFAKSKKIYIEKDISYGDALIDIVNNHKDIKFVGHSCTKRTPYKLKDSIVWEIKFQ